MSLKTKIGSLFRPKQNSELRDRAELELQESDRVCGAIFDLNNNALFSDPVFAKQVMASQVLSYSHIDVGGLFLLGIFFEFLEGRPPLPTPLYERALLLITAFFHRGGSSLDEARARVQNVAAQYNKADLLSDFIISSGRAACRDGGDQHLIACHEAAIRTANLRYI